MKRSSSDGFIIVFLSFVISQLHGLSLVEWLKSFGLWISKTGTEPRAIEEVRRTSNFCIDLFILLKWIVVCGFFAAGSEGRIALLVTAYLLFYNTFSYFYYHGWGSGYQIEQLSKDAALERDRRRLVSFLLAFFFTFVCFAYIYGYQYPSRFSWPTEPNRLDALYLSVSNSFTLTYEGFQPNDKIARGILLLQVVNVFVFVSVLIGSAIPSVGRSS